MVSAPSEWVIALSRRLEKTSFTGGWRGCSGALEDMRTSISRLGGGWSAMTVRRTWSRSMIASDSLPVSRALQAADVLDQRELSSSAW
jgi:hypothetical protein